jgi:hypothetical protein
VNLCLWRSASEGTRVVLVGDVLRTRFPVVIFEPGRGVVRRFLPAAELRFCVPVAERTSRSPARRFLALGRRVGISAAARDLLRAELRT